MSRDNRIGICLATDETCPGNNRIGRCLSTGETCPENNRIGRCSSTGETCPENNRIGRCLATCETCSGYNRIGRCLSTGETCSGNNRINRCLSTGETCSGNNRIKQQRNCPFWIRNTGYKNKLIVYEAQTPFMCLILPCQDRDLARHFCCSRKAAIYHNNHATSLPGGGNEPLMEEG